VSDDQLGASYARLLFAYPREYRRERGRELVDMYAEMAGDRGRPSVADALDLVAGGIRERVRAAGLAGIVRAVPTAAVFVLSVLAGLSVYYLVAFELRGSLATESGGSFGPFATFFACAYGGWLVTAVLWATGSPRAARVAAALSFVLVLAGLGIRGAHLPVPDLKTFIPFALAVLGVMAVPLPSRPSRAARLAPVVTAAVVGVLGAARVPIGRPALYFGGTSIWEPGDNTYATCCNYLLPATYVLHLAAVALLTAGLIFAVVLARRGEARGAWTLLVLVSPAMALSSVWLHDTIVPLRDYALTVTGYNEVTVCIAGAVAVLSTAIGLPLLTSLIHLLVRLKTHLTHRPQ
jgi:hypothetical protein